MSEETPTKRLRTPAQIAAAIHCFFDNEAGRSNLVEEDLTLLFEVQQETLFPYHSGRQAAMTAYLESVEIDRWTLTKDALPAETGAYLAVIKRLDKSVSLWYWQHSNTWDSDSETVKASEVTHWMPLPSLPQAD